MIDKIMIMYEGRTYVVFEDDISEKLWQELKDNILLTAEDSFKRKDGGSSFLQLGLFLSLLYAVIALFGYVIYELLSN